MLKSKGHLKSVTQLFNKKYQVVFEMEKPPTYKEDDLLNIEVKKYRKGRSLNANAYFHALNDKLASAKNVSTIEMKNMLLQDYGTLEDLPAIALHESINYLKQKHMHLYPTGRSEVMESGAVYYAFLVIKHTAEYDSKEMARLIDGTVSECKEVGIETLTPRELEEMKERWNVWNIE